MSYKDVLLSKSWFGFDLDDTLHEFSKASGAALRPVFTIIADTYRNDISLAELKPRYSQVLKASTQNAFTDGKKSTEYRKERFRVLLNSFQLPHSDDFLGTLAAAYKSALGRQLELKPGALELLRYLKEIGKSVIIITEGPKDAQEWTLHELGLEPYVDVVVTSNEIGKSKFEGLIAEVLRIHHISVKDMVYIGDNETRDIIPTVQEGIMAIHYNEQEESRLCVLESLIVKPQMPFDAPLLCTSSLAMIQQLMEHK